MDHIADTGESDLTGKMLFASDFDEDTSAVPDAERLASDADTQCEFEELSRAAGIDSSSLTDVQIMEALYQLR